MASEETGNVVVVAADGSEHSDYTLKWYAGHLHKPKNVVYIVHCVEVKSVTTPGTAVKFMSGERFMHEVTKKIEEEQKHAKALDDKLAKDLEQLKISGHVHQVHGNPGHAIIDFARVKNATFIVIGSRGKGTVRRTLTGSVTDFVVHHSEIPVVVCKHQDFHQHHFHLKNPFHKHHKDEKGKDVGENIGQEKDSHDKDK